MKAEEYLKSKRLKNPPLDSGISGGGDAPRIRVSDMMNEYAKDQIEKDRLRITKSYYNETDTSDFNEMMKNIPIILD